MSFLWRSRGPSFARVPPSGPPAESGSQLHWFRFVHYLGSEHMPAVEGPTPASAMPRVTLSSYPHAIPMFRRAGGKGLLFSPTRRPLARKGLLFAPTRRPFIPKGLLVTPNRRPLTAKGLLFPPTRKPFPPGSLLFTPTRRPFPPRGLLSTPTRRPLTQKGRAIASKMLGDFRVCDSIEKACHSEARRTSDYFLPLEGARSRKGSEVLRASE
jgi:hypothetical protein